MTNPYTGKPQYIDVPPIANDGFWNDLSLSDLMAIYRIPNEYEPEILHDGLANAIIEVNKQLKPVKTFLAVTYTDIAAYTLANPEQIGSVDIIVTKYQEAVFSYAKALLLQQFKTINRKAEAENQAKESPATESYWMKKSMNAVFFLYDKFNIDFATGKFNSNLPFAVLI